LASPARQTTKQMRDQEEAVKKKIVDGYKRGVCTHAGGHIPPEKRGMAGKGSHFRPAPGPNWDAGYKQAFGHD